MNFYTLEIKVFMFGNLPKINILFDNVHFEMLIVEMLTLKEFNYYYFISTINRAARETGNKCP